jgi:elongation factor 1-alpha
MSVDIYDITKHGERRNIEFKENLEMEYHLKKDRIQRLASQMKYRMEKGDGEAVYFLGVDDDGNLVGLRDDKMEESLYVLEKVAHSIGAKINHVQKQDAGKGTVAKVLVGKETNQQKKHLLVGVVGHVDHGKSTLVGTLTSGSLDNGSGRTRIYLDVQKHEIERGLSADLSFAVYGFREGKPVRIANPLHKKEKSKVVEQCEKVVSFVDTVGHEPWLRTTIRGIVGQKLDFGLLTIAADQGPTAITREHLGIVLAMEVPLLVTITKIDMVTEDRTGEVKDEVFELLKMVGKIPFMVKTIDDAVFVAGNMNQHLVPVIKVSPVTGDGLDLLDKLFCELNVQTNANDGKKPFMMYIDKIYTVTGVGTVVSGTVRQGTVKKGDKLLLGPTGTGKFIPITVRSIEMHYYKKDSAETGEVVGISLSGADVSSIKRGMIISDLLYKPQPVREFEADVSILVHPTTIRKGYECITHIETISDTTIFQPLDNEYLSAGDTGKIRMKFKYRPYAIREGQKLIFREGRSKGVGKVSKIY